MRESPKPSAAASEPGHADRFDERYYKQFYGGRSPVHTRARIAHLASGVTGLIRWWDLPLRNVLDVGAGPGYWRDWFAANQPRVRYRSTDISSYACKRYGHEQRDITVWSPSKAYDLVVCQGVLHYLDDRSAEAAITNLTSAARGVLYLEAPTSEDRESVLDLDVSDMHAYWRPASWYRDRLDQAFVQAGAGLWIRRGRLLLYHLEASS